MKSVGVPDCFGQSGSYEEILKEAGLDPESIMQWSLRALEAKAALACVNDPNGRKPSGVKTAP